jgi:hypothetical protein
MLDWRNYQNVILDDLEKYSNPLTIYWSKKGSIQMTSEPSSKKAAKVENIP